MRLRKNTGGAAGPTPPPFLTTPDEAPPAVVGDDFDGPVDETWQEPPPLDGEEPVAVRPISGAPNRRDADGPRESTQRRPPPGIPQGRRIAGRPSAARELEEAEEYLRAPVGQDGAPDWLENNQSRAARNAVKSTRGGGQIPHYANAYKSGPPPPPPLSVITVNGRDPRELSPAEKQARVKELRAELDELEKARKEEIHQELADLEDEE